MKICGIFVFSTTTETKGLVTQYRCLTHQGMFEDLWPVCSQYDRNKRPFHCHRESSHGHTPVPQTLCTRQQLEDRKRVHICRFTELLRHEIKKKEREKQDQKQNKTNN